MIRINLIGQKAKAKPATASRGQLFIVLGVVLLEAIFLFVWYQKLSTELTDATKRTKEANTKIEDLKKVKQAWEAWQSEKADLDRQTAVFDALRADQQGPPAMLQYLAYMLTKVPDVPSAADEMKAQELAGWTPNWDPRRVWIRALIERGGIMTINGDAVDHEDVAEFYRRLETSEYFQNIEPGLQSRRSNSDLNLKYVEFTATASLNYKVQLEPSSGQPGGPKAPGAAPEAPGTAPAPGAQASAN